MESEHSTTEFELPLIIQEYPFKLVTKGHQELENYEERPNYIICGLRFKIDNPQDILQWHHFVDVDTENYDIDSQLVNFLDAVVRKVQATKVMH